jgi:hypothetical protein
MARLRDIVIDCACPAALARFWAATLEDHAVAPYDEDELQRLRSIGVDDPEDDPTVLVVGPPDLPRLWFQKVPEPKIVKNRVHLDIACDDAAVEVTRLVALGARVADHQPNEALIRMEDPEGNEFCVLRPDLSGERSDVDP